MAKVIKRQEGYIAVVTALIFMVVTLGLAASAGTGALLSRQSKNEFLNKQASYLAARTCLDRARLQLGQNWSSYAGNETVNVYDYRCSVLAIQNSGQNKIITATSSVLSAFTNLRLTVDAALTTIAFEEIIAP
jgi:type II secretory pathway pseudopilin PulG